MTDEQLLEKLKSTTISFSDEIVSRENSDGTVIIMKMDEGDDFYKMNGIAAIVYKSLESNQPIEEICNNILDTYEVTPEVVYKDIDSLLTELHKVGILV